MCSVAATQRLLSRSRGGGAGGRPQGEGVRMRPLALFSPTHTPRCGRDKSHCRQAGSGGTVIDDEPDTEFSTPIGAIEVVEADEADVDAFGELSTGNLHFTDDDHEQPAPGADSTLGLQHVDEIVSMPYGEVKSRVQSLLRRLGAPAAVAASAYPAGQPQRAIFCSRTLNLRSIQAIGYDMDYTLIHYSVEAWEGRAYSYGMAALREMGFPVDGLRFVSDLVIRGLLLDTELGNVVKADRFGFIKRAMHGTRMLSPAEVRTSYGRELVDLHKQQRWVFLNTLFSVSEAVMFAQLVDRLDHGAIAHQVCPHSYAALYKAVSKALFLAHVEGKLKAEIVRDPGRFVELDADLPMALLDQRQAGKTLLLITNSDYSYTDAVMTHAYDQFLPEGMRWRDLFDYVIVNARKPEFFRSSQTLYEVATPNGLLRPATTLRRGGAYCGGTASQVESALGVAGDDVLYVGDHIYTDAALAKLELKWRTCLIVRELELEVEALAAGRGHREHLKDALNKKERVGDALNVLRLARQRALAERRAAAAAAPVASGSGLAASPGNGAAVAASGPPGGGAAVTAGASDCEEARINEALAELLAVLERLDDEIGPLIETDGEHFNRRWGYLTRCGVNDRSQLLRQIEKYADVYTSRVSNFGRYSPFVYFRSPAQSMAHDRPSADGRVLGTEPYQD